MGKLMNLNYDFDGSSVYGFEDVNSSFARGSIKILYTGQNRNGSRISREAAEHALPSLKYVPIVCHMDYENNEIGGHDIALVETGDGDLRVRNATEPVGVVPADAEFRFVSDSDDNGVQHEYLVADGVLLWKRQDAYRHIMEDLGGKIGHSMEINVIDGGSDKSSQYYDIRRFEFTALCLLENVQPCFEGSGLELFELNHMQEKMAEMMAEFKESFNLITPPESGADDICDYSTEGGRILEEKLKVIEEYGLNIDGLDFAIDDFTVEELREKFDAMVSAAAAQEPAAEAVEPVAEEPVVVEPVAEPAPVAGAEFEEAAPVAAEPVAEPVIQWEAMYNDLLAESKTMQAELAELRQFKAEIEAERFAALREELFARFMDLSGIEEFEMLKKNSDSYDIDTLEEKCYAIRGKCHTPAQFSLEPKAQKIVIEQREPVENEPYGGLMSRYGIAVK